MSGSLKVLRRGSHYVIQVDDAVWGHLGKIRETHSKYIFNAKEILLQLMDLGLDGLNNTVQFKFEGRFSDGTTSGTEVAVYAVKAHQLRIYGGFRIVDGEKSFVCIESVIKRTDKADQAQLKRVAKKLGKCGNDAG